MHIAYPLNHFHMISLTSSPSNLLKFAGGYHEVQLVKFILWQAMSQVQLEPKRMARANINHAIAGNRTAYEYRVETALKLISLLAKEFEVHNAQKISWLCH